MSRSRRTLTLGLLVCITAVAFEGMAVVTAMPAAAADLGDAELYAWAFSAVMIPQMFAIAAAGRIVDRTGPVRPLLVGLALFAAGVVVAALAPTMLVLLLGRFIQGLGGGAVNLCLLVVTAQGYDPVERARIMTWYSACWMMPAFVGPGVAAWVAEQFSWHWVFWMILPFIALGLGFMASGLRHLPPRADGEAPESPVPLMAAVEVAVGLALVQAAGQQLGWMSVPWLVVGAGCLLHGWPKLMPRGFRVAVAGLSAVVMVRFLAAGVFFGMQSFLPLMLTSRGISLIVSGAVITIASVGWMLGSWLQARSWLRLSRDQIIIAGTVCVAVGAAVTATAAWLPALSLPLSLLGFTASGLGMGLQSASTSLAVMQLSPEQEIGRNSSSLQVGESAGNALLVGAAGTVYAALAPIAAPATVFGTQMTALATIALLAIVAARRIGFVENHSLLQEA